jgi:hypothetical protein
MHSVTVAVAGQVDQSAPTRHPCFPSISGVWLRLLEPYWAEPDAGFVTDSKPDDVGSEGGGQAGA